MTDPHHKPNRRPGDDGGLGLGLSIIAAFAIMIVLGLAFWTLNDSDRVTALNTAPGTTPGITTGIAPSAK